MDAILPRGRLRRVLSYKLPRGFFFLCKRFLIILPDETEKLGNEDLMALLREHGNLVKNKDFLNGRFRDGHIKRWLQKNLKMCEKVCYQDGIYSHESFMDIVTMFDTAVIYSLSDGAVVRRRTSMGSLSTDRLWDTLLNLELVVHQPSDTNIRNDVESVGIVQQFIHGNDLTTLIQQFRQKPRSIGSFFVIHVANPFRLYEVFISLDANVFDEPRLGRSAAVCHTQRYKVCFSDDVELHVDIWDDQTMIHGYIVAKELIH